MSSYKPVQQHAHNDRGRDLIVTDVHGCYDSLMRALDEAKFDPACDRVFSLGDLLNRGPKSWEVLKLTIEPWMYMVRGNHEDMLLSALERFESIYHSSADFLGNGGKWLLTLSDEQAHELQTVVAPKLLATPHVRTVVGPTNGKVSFHTAHAELLKPKQSMRFDTTDGDDDDRSCGFYTDVELALLARDYVPVHWDEDKFMAICAWGRRAVNAVMSDVRHDRPVEHFDDFPLAHGRARLAVSPQPYAPGLSPVFVGHTILGRLAMHASHIFTDLGCVSTYCSTHEDNGQLTLIDVHQALEWLERNLPQQKDVELDPMTVPAKARMPLP